ncbi:MAG: dTMP kinase, partial [Elusimicrobia bacterium]|nr:dTMP kinase [Elusimicrobiota bacterium]
MKRKKSFFITIEGGEGCGKTTQSKLLKKYLEDKGFKVVLTREPGGSIVAEQIRNILLNPSFKVNPLSELMLYEASRAQHLEEIIKPNLKKGFIVICDRFIDSTLAYQGYGRGLDKNIIKKLNDIASCGITPDITFYLDVDPKEGIKRAKSVNKGKLTGGDRIEKESIKFHNKVRKGFLDLAKKYS